MPENRFKKLFKEADAAFNGEYKAELDKLAGLSRDEIDSIVPGTEDLRVYSVLVKVVETASRKNVTQAKLASDIKELGGIAIKIAKKVPKLAAILA